MEMETTKRFNQLVEHHEREPVNGQLEDCTKKVQIGEKIESSSHENDQDIASEQ